MESDGVEIDLEFENQTDVVARNSKMDKPGVVCCLGMQGFSVVPSLLFGLLVVDEGSFALGLLEYQSEYCLGISREPQLEEHLCLSHQKCVRLDTKL